MVPLTIDFANLHTILGTLYEDMLPLCKDMMDVGKGLAGLGALFYVAVRIWQSMARAEPIDVYPLLRPFAIGICILLFPTLVLGTLNTVLSPIVQGTHKMLEGQTLDMERYRAQKEELEKEAMLRNPETAYLVSDEEFDRQLDELGWSTVDTASRLGMYVEVGMYNLEKKIRDTFRSLLELIFAAASLLIDTVRTFFLVVLSILGPVAFAFSVSFLYADRMFPVFLQYGQWNGQQRDVADGRRFSAVFQLDPSFPYPPVTEIVLYQVFTTQSGDIGERQTGEATKCQVIPFRKNTASKT